jgi:hypothetical protein
MNVMLLESIGEIGHAYQILIERQRKMGQKYKIES